jgi:hypothetical protein
VLGDVAIIHHVDQASHRREYQRFFVCWAFCHNPSQIPQLMYLTLADRHADPRLDVHLQFLPCTMKQGHTFRLLIHIDSIEDLSFYHRPADQLNAEGRVQLREFCWALGHLDGDMDDDDVRMAPRFYRSSDGPIRRHRDEDDADRDCGCPRHRELLGSISRCLGQRRSRAPPADRDRHGGWFRGESSRRCGVPARDASSPPSRGTSTLRKSGLFVACGLMWMLGTRSRM